MVALEAVPKDDEFDNVCLLRVYLLLSAVFIFPVGILAISINTIRFTFTVIFIFFTPGFCSVWQGIFPLWLDLSLVDILNLSLLSSDLMSLDLLASDCLFWGAVGMHKSYNINARINRLKYSIENPF